MIPLRTPTNAHDSVTQIKAELARLTEAVAIGGDVPVLVDAIRTREERRRVLQQQIRQSQAPRVDQAAIATDLRARLQAWRELLSGSSPEARALMRLLIIDRLTLRPESRGYVFSGTGTVQPLLEGIIPSTARLEWRPHRDSNPGFSLERAAS